MCVGFRSRCSFASGQAAGVRINDGVNGGTNSTALQIIVEPMRRHV